MWCTGHHKVAWIILETCHFSLKDATYNSKYLKKEKTIFMETRQSEEAPRKGGEYYITSLPLILEIIT